MNARSAFLRGLSATFLLVVCPCSELVAAPGVSVTSESADVQQLDWESLLPAEERENYNPAPPPPVHDYLGEGSLTALQTGSTEVNRALDGKRVRVPGFVVPLERSADGLISTFFLVPYFGACIHVPPPPPNQIVYVIMKEGAGLRSIDDAVWVVGTLHAKSRRSELGSAAYTLDGEKLEPYQYTR